MQVVRNKASRTRVRMNAGRQYIFANYANILVEAGSETFVREKRDRCLRRYSELFSILSG